MVVVFVSMVIVSDRVKNEIIHNKNTHLVSSIHAEVAAIYDAVKYLTHKGNTQRQIMHKFHCATLIVVRVSGDKLQSSAPCMNCIKIIKSYGIRKIIYSDNSNNNTPIINNHVLINTKTNKLNSTHKTRGARHIERILQK